MDRLAKLVAVNEIIAVSSLPYMMLHPISRAVLAIAFVALLPATVFSQATPTAKTTPAVFDADSARLAELPWRSIGPALTSGRVVDFAVPAAPKSHTGHRLRDLLHVAPASRRHRTPTNG